MSQEEFYIRTPEGEEAQGPYKIDQLQSLAEASKIDRETLVYDDTMEVWIEVGKHESLCQEVFPQRRKLTLKSAADPKPVEPTGVETPPKDDQNTDAAGNPLPEHDVEEMLAAAEGQTADTEHLKRRQERQAAAASLSLPALGAMMLLSSVSLLYPNWEVIQTAFLGDEVNYLAAFRPMIVLGALDLVFGIFLLLAVSEIFPAIRLRAALGLGYWAFIFWAGGDPALMAIGVAAHLALFICTITLNLYLMMLGMVAGIIGFGLLAYMAFNGALMNFL